MLICMLFFIGSICFGQSKKTLKVVDKQLVLNSSVEYKEIEKYLQSTRDSLDQVLESWVTDWKSKIQSLQTTDFFGNSEEQRKSRQKKLKKEEQLLYSFGQYRRDTCDIIEKEIEVLAFNVILEKFNMENKSKQILVVDKSEVLYFDENSDLTESLQKFVSSEIPPKDIRENIFFPLCQKIFRKYRLEEMLSLKCSPHF